jgi:hypothetical protein
MPFPCAPLRLADPVVQERFRKAGQEIWPAEEQTPEALAAK